MAYHRTYGMGVFVIHPKIAKRIAVHYVDIYSTQGFEEARRYLLRLTRGNSDIQNELGHYIVEEGKSRRR